MSHPPLDPPPFDPPVIRRCIKTHVRIQNHEGLEEVFILTPVLWESQLNANSNANRSLKSHQEDDSEEDNRGDTSSSSEYMSYSSETSSGKEDSDSDAGSGNDVNSRAQNGYAPQCRRGNEERNRLKAFWYRRDPIRKNPHGMFTTDIFYARVLHKADIYWVATDEEVALKAVSWRCIRACQQNRLSEDFVKEISALQYLSQWRKKEMPNDETHVITADTVMCDEDYLYAVMPFCSGGDLCQRVAESERFTEDQSRYWFRQILKGLETLQRARICHRDLSPENVIIMDGTAFVIDLGMCLRIPYTDEERYLISAQNPCGKPPHIAPEIYRRLPFDGHAIDVWAAGTILFFMLTGERYPYPLLIARVFEGVELGLSYEATDLLRRIFRLEPNDRLTLQQIQQHPFVTRR